MIGETYSDLAAYLRALAAWARGFPGVPDAVTSEFAAELESAAGEAAEMREEIDRLQAEVGLLNFRLDGLDK